MTLSEKILALRHVGISAASIARWGKKLGYEISGSTILSHLYRDSMTASPAIVATVDDLHQRLCACESDASCVEH